MSKKPDEGGQIWCYTAVMESVPLAPLDECVIEVTV